MTSELGVTEHMEGDECKFAVWTGRAPLSDCRIVLRANSLDSKQAWVKQLRQVIQETYFGNALPLAQPPKSPARGKHSQRSSRDLEECNSLDESVENLDRNSLASFGSGNTTDSDKAGVVEMTWVINDHVASPGTQELSVRKGQQVEVVEVSTTRPDYCVVRMPTQGPDLGAVPEGLVPISVLKPQPAPRASPSRRQQPNLSIDHDADAAASDSSGTINTSSPVNKRRGFSSRKWLPPPLRKLSQGKVEKGQNNVVERPTPLKKAGSDKRFKLPSEMGNKPASSEGDGEGDEDTSTLTNGAPDEPEEEPVELPPPMKPLQEPLIVAPTAPASCTVTANTTIPEDSREQHTENQERHSLLRDCKSADPLTECDETSIEGGSGGEGSTNKLASGGESGSGEEVSDSEQALRKRDYVIRELADSEETYVRDLAQITEGYLACMRDPNFIIPVPEDLKGTKQKMIFGNIEAIHEWHRDFFSKALRRCVEHPAELGPLFRRCERKLHMYVVYCQNKPVSEHIVSEHLDGYFEELRQHLGHKLQLCDLLIKPVQRITKYQLLLKEALACTERAGLSNEIVTLRHALHVMHVVPKAANDMMDVGRLQGFDGKLSAQGRLQLHGPLLCSETPSGPKKELQVFLFEQAVIFSDAVGKKTAYTSPVYVYKAHFQVNKMAMEENQNGSFTLRSTDPRRPNLQFTCEASTPDLRTQWLRTLHAILQTQKDFLKAIQSPIAYQKELTKDASSGNELSNNWSPSLRKTNSVPIQPSKVSRKQKSGPGILQGFRNSISRRWSDSDPPGRPHLASKPTDVIASANSDAIIECKLDSWTNDLFVTWRKIEPNPIVLRSNDRIQMTLINGIATLLIKNCHESDSGIYQCTIANDNGTVQCIANLNIIPSKHLQAEVITCSSVALSYVSEICKNSDKWHVEYCEAGTAHWQTAVGGPRNGHYLVEHLIPGTSYTFRINGGQPSAAVALPPADSSRRAQEQFHRRYAEGEELGRGRYSIVRAATDRGTGQKVALKQAWRARRSRSATHSEYSLLSSTEHQNLLRALAMFEHAPRPGMDTIVMELVRGPPILEYLCRCTEYTEGEVSFLSRQLAGALSWLHLRNIAHRDLRPENVIVDNSGSAPNVKLIDLGAAVGLPEPPACIECTAPECIAALRNPECPKGCPSDMWSFGVLIYVMLSGLSPFLDDSDEETTSNVLKCDYCFPDDYFLGVSDDAKELIRQLLILQPERRITIAKCLESPWIVNDTAPCIIPSTRLSAFVERRQPSSSVPRSPLHNLSLNDY